MYNFEMSNSKDKGLLKSIPKPSWFHLCIFVFATAISTVTLCLAAVNSHMLGVVL